MGLKNMRKNMAKLVFGDRKKSEYVFQKKEEQLHREKVMLGYDYMRSAARPSR